MTPLDDALLAAQSDPSLVDPFYSVFLGSALFVPIYENPNLPVGGSVRLDQDTPVRPIVIPDGDVEFIPIFDTLDKLVTWAQQQVQYIQVPAYAFLEGLSPHVHLALNPGHSPFKEFVPEEIAWLKSWAKQQTQETTLQAGTSFRIEAPKRIPHAMQSKLFDCFSQNPEVKSAYLAKCQYEGKPAGWILVLELKGKKTSFENLSKEIGIALQGTLGSQVGLDILPKRGEQLDIAVTEAVAPFYVRPAFH